MLDSIRLKLASDILRRYPEHSADVIGVVKKCLKAIDEPEAKVSISLIFDALIFW